MDLLNTNNTLSSKIHNIPKVVFKEGSLKITAGAMREIVDMLCIKDVDNVLEELGKIIPVSESLKSDIKIRNGLLTNCKM
ncbi:hypothetical protein JDFnp4_11 [Fusobacterium phage JD-Fnp4]|jgi:hypothetical protein|nr:hypothetical protein JDFnp4_11 [Fusobacterium phage JD-Fnp4]DAR93306.1 MAG TPA: hypothetical protein [Caudoviricetes sp.]